MDTAKEWLGLILCIALTCNAYACGYVEWKDNRSRYDKFFSILFYTLGTLLLGIAVYAIATVGF